MPPKEQSAKLAKLLPIQIQVKQITPLGFFFILLLLVLDPPPILHAAALPDLSQPPTQVLVQPSDGLGKENDGFGMSISAALGSSSSPTVVIGAPFEDRVGAAYVFGRGGNDEEWTQQQRLAVDGSEAFGSSVAANGDGDLIVVGDPDLRLDGTLWDPHGAAHIFYRDGSGNDQPWQYVDRVTSPIVEDRRGGFGVAVAAGPGRFAIGEKGAGIAGSYHNVGAVHVYSYIIDGATGGMPPTWELVQTIYPPDPYQGPAFGSSVSLAADTLAIGEPNRRTGEGFDLVMNVGRAYVYRWAGDDSTPRFELDAVLAPETDDRKQYFGTSVAVSGDESTVAVGAEGDWLTQVRGGGAYAFDVTSDPPVRTPLVPEGGVTEIARFGRSVAVTSDGSFVAVGAPGMLQGGAAYLFSAGSGGGEHLNTVRAELEPLNLGHAVAFAGDGGSTTTLMVTDPGDVPEKVHVYADDARQQGTDDDSDSNAQPTEDTSPTPMPTQAPVGSMGLATPPTESLGATTVKPTVSPTPTESTLMDDEQNIPPSEAVDAASRSENAAASGGGDDSATTVRSSSLLCLLWTACVSAVVTVGLPF